MILPLFAVLPILFVNLIAAQSSSLNVVCIAGQCVQGISNTTLGAKLSASNSPMSLQLLPDTYTTTGSPQILHDLLTSSGAALSPFSGFENATKAFNPLSLPLELEMSPGMTLYTGVLYSGQASYSEAPVINGTDGEQPSQVTAGSFVLADNMYAVVGGSSGSNDRVVVWSSVPDTSQLPLSSTSSSSTTLSLYDIMSFTCNPACSSNGICSPLTNTCICAPGFNGTSCETCASGFFGSTCKQCPGGCDQCDDGIQGTGRCLKKTIIGDPESCGCVNGQCGNGGQCACNAGWKDGSDGKKCSTCQDGFYLTSSGDCQVCQAGCVKCADSTGVCLQCKSGFSVDSADRTKCDFIPTSGQQCPDGSFSNGANCTSCSSACETCSGATSNDCIVCQSGSFMFNGNCVSANEDGVCQGTTGLVANNNKRECDACPSKCTSCRIPQFDVASTFDQLQCTGCLPGLVLSQGKCVQSCPVGTFISPQDNLSCIPCDSSCSTCADAADFCLACSESGQLAHNGNCTSSCPFNTFTTSGTSACMACHPDCGSCSGPQFNQCTSCPPSRPALQDGRCLPMCAKGEFFDKGSSSCKNCDDSCATCSASGADQCLSCVDGEVLRLGRCVKSNGGCQTLKGLGICLNDLVFTPNSTTGADIPSPSVTSTTSLTGVKIENKFLWWQILLMISGGIFMGLVVIILWRRNARKKRAETTRLWAMERGVLGGKGGSWWRKIFARRPQHSYNLFSEKEDWLPRYHRDDTNSERLDSTVDGLTDGHADKHPKGKHRLRKSTFGSRSLFSEITGEQKKVPEPRMPVREHSMSVRSLHSIKSTATFKNRKPADVETEAEKYARSLREKAISHPGVAPFIATEPLGHPVRPVATGGSDQSRNPFRP